MQRTRRSLHKSFHGSGGGSAHTVGTIRTSVSDLSMPLQPSIQACGDPSPPPACPRCGGSGQLRTGHGAYRTCLECAGRGWIGSGLLHRR
jgi:DnaJ-class molecular chaperone